MTPEELAKAEIEAMAEAMAETEGHNVVGVCMELATAAHAAAAKVREEAGFYTLRILEDGEQHDPH